MLTQILGILALVAVPVAAIVIVDDWFLRPRRQLAAPAGAVIEPRWLAVLYQALPVLLFAAVVRMLMSERLDFSLVLVLAVAVAGVVWLLDKLLLEPLRRRQAAALGRPVETASLPVTVDYARSLLPVMLIVLVVRSFIFEPFRIPSASMTPTLVTGDFIFVNKFAYGLRLPVLNTKIVELGEPQRGDVVVFRLPADPRVNYVKRVVGLPGDVVEYHPANKRITINGELVPIEMVGPYKEEPDTQLGWE